MRPRCFLLVQLLVGVCLTCDVCLAHQLTIDFQTPQGQLRPLHGVNLGPLCYRGTVDLSAYHRELGIPLTRLHDVPWVNAEAVDIHTIFPDFRNDPAQPASYFFAVTDDYIRAITNVQSRIVYRLGESIEHTARKYHVHPPADLEKWAAIGLGVIRHYNQGWSGGFRHNIEYWEIWNEPDVRPAMWTGSDEEYFRLYEVTSKAIKSAFPEVKVGGPALGGTGQWTGEKFQPAPFFTKFLEYCAKHSAPLDFFSWHCYTSQPWELPRRARAVRAVLNEGGFSSAESHLNEWNYLPNDDWRPLVREGQGELRERWFEQMNGPAGAAFTAAALLLLQDAPLAAANFYTGEIQGFGLFNMHGVPKTTYYAFKAFHDLLNTPERVRTQGEEANRWAVAAGVDSGRSRAGVLVSHFSGSDGQLEVVLNSRPWPGSSAYEILAIDSTHQLTPLAGGTLPSSERSVSFSLNAPAVALLQLRPAAP
jgi:hypothetical protein